MAVIETSDLASYTTKRFLGVKDGTLIWADAPDDISFYGSLAAAITAIGATKTTLRISSPITISANVTVPINISLEIANDALITINTGVTLTILSMVNAGSRQLFTGAGTVKYGNASVFHMDLAWRAGNANLADVSTAMAECLASAQTYKGVGRIYVPHNVAEIDGEVLLTNVNTVVIFGNGNSPSGTAGYGTTLQLKSTSTADYMFKIGTNRSAIRFKNITLYGNGVDADGVLCEGAGGSGTTAVDISFDKVTFDNFTKGWNHHSLSDSFQAAQVSFNQCYWKNCATSFAANSVNGGYVLTSSYFEMPHYGIGFDLVQCGALTVNGYEFSGSLKTLAFTSSDVNTSSKVITKTAHGFTDLDEVTLLTDGARPVTSPANGLNSIFYIKVLTANTFKFSSTPDGLTIINMTTGGTGTHTIYRRTSKACVIGGSHAPISFNGGQDEACLTFVENNGSDQDSIINVHQANVQSKFLLNESCQVNVSQSTLPCHVFQGAPDIAYVSITACEGTDISVNDGSTVTPRNYSQMTGGGIIVKQDIGRVGKFIQRYYQTTYTPAFFDGEPTKTVHVVGHQTLISENKNLLFLGLTDAVGEPVYGYFFRRKYSDGWLEITGNQTAPNIGLRINGPIVSQTPESLIIPCSDESTALTTGTAKITFRMPYKMTLIDIRASVNTAPTGSALIVDVNEGGGSILSTKLSIDATEKTSKTAAVPAVISDPVLADDAEITIDVDQVGSTVAGAGLKVTLIGYRTE